MTIAPPSARLLWIVNHNTLLRAEVPILRSLGWEIFIPKAVPAHDSTYRSAEVSWEYDSTVTAPASVLRVLNRHNFYEQTWAPTIISILNNYFSVVIASFSYYTMPLFQATRHFHGKVIARPFGREHPRTYTEIAQHGRHPQLLSSIAALEDRFVFGQAYDNLADIEATELRRRAYTIPVTMPSDTQIYCNSWHGGGSHAIFLCPNIAGGGYYSNSYNRIKHEFGSLPHLIFGKQHEPIDDPSVLPYLTTSELYSLYAAAPVFVYPHTEPRHIHYSPLEAILVGTPTLYLRGTLMCQLAGGDSLPGSCADLANMRSKAQRLVSGDVGLATEIRDSQTRILDKFCVSGALARWAEILKSHDQCVDILAA